MNNKWMVFLFGVLVSGVAFAGEASHDVNRKLAVMLSDEGDHHAAAIEFRRLAMQSDADSQGGYYRSAAYEYIQAGGCEEAADQLSKVRDYSSQDEQKTLLLQAENALRCGDDDAARFYLQCLIDSGDLPDPYRQWGGRQMAGVELRSGQLRDAENVLVATPGDQQVGLDAVRRYMQGKDKKPLVGGLLGMIPGLGYMYSGEYANGVRSILLNGLFIFGMVATAEQDQWGGFAVISFFEITWYSGSIYGGIDAAHRYNRRRLEQCEEGILGAASFQADYVELPIVSFSFEF